jgi:hypothetical protein
MCGIWAYVLHTPISNIHTIDSTFPDNFKNALDFYKLYELYSLATY